MGDGSFGPSSWLSSLTSPDWAEAHARRIAIVAALATSSLAIGQPETLQHRGHPLSQAHCVTRSREFASHVSARSKPAAAKPAPPGAVSYTKTVTASVSGCLDEKAPATSFRSEPATDAKSDRRTCSDPVSYTHLTLPTKRIV